MKLSFSSGFARAQLILAALVILVVGAWLAYFFQDDLFAFLQSSQVKNLPVIGGLAEKVQKEVNYSTPLRSDRNAPNSHLTKDGVITWTNMMREQDGKTILTENELLNQSAKKKLDDMFQRQYFEHETPTGEGPSDFTDSVGYEYITVGENLALGNFENDKDLVNGWMNSPGHRANILNPKYTEIGVAVGEGMFEGRKTWLAVQHFGKPVAACPAVNDSLLTSSKEKSTQADALAKDIEARKQSLETNRPTTQEEADEYNRKVSEYNDKVKQYNALVEEIKSLTAQYNQQVNAFNACADI